MFQSHSVNVTASGHYYYGRLPKNITDEQMKELVAKFHDSDEVKDESDIVFSAQAVAASVPSYYPTGIRIDWVDLDVNVTAQVVRFKDSFVYDWTTISFEQESQAANSGLIQLARPYVGTIRGGYQEILLPTPSTVFQDGRYLIFYFDNDNKLLDTSSFGVYQGVPYESPDVPANALANGVPSTADNAIKLLSADLSKHNTPGSPGAALNKLLNS